MHIIERDWICHSLSGLRQANHQSVDAVVPINFSSAPISAYSGPSEDAMVQKAKSLQCEQIITLHTYIHMHDIAVKSAQKSLKLAQAKSFSAFSIHRNPKILCRVIVPACCACL